MRIKNHRVEGLSFAAAHFTGEVITPEIVVLHDTAGRLTKGNSAAYLASKNVAKASVHFVIETDGTISQHVPTNRRANHAGVSTFHGRQGCNGFSIGIEIVNPGKMVRLSETQAKAWWGESFLINLFDIREIETKEHGRGLWMPYRTEQIASLIDLLTCLFRDVPSLKHLTTHWYISPGRKVDTNPLLPLAELQAAILGPDDPAEQDAEDQSEVLVMDEMVEIEAGAGETLNMRRWPSFNPNVIAAIPDGVIVPVRRRGVFEGREWLRVLYGGQEGWIVARYAAPIIFNT